MCKNSADLKMNPVSIRMVLCDDISIKIMYAYTKATSLDDQKFVKVQSAQVDQE